MSQTATHLLSIHDRLCEHGIFAPRVENRGQPRSATPEVEEGILDLHESALEGHQCNWVSLT
jgi:hypothetical protein